MSLHFIIDGYNLIGQAGSALCNTNLKDSRAALIRFLTTYRPQGSANNRVTVVFDGKEGNYYSRPNTEIDVVFTQNQSADDKIKKLVECAQNPRNMVVVTNDREIQVFVRHAGAKVKTVEEFLARFGSLGQAKYNRLVQRRSNNKRGNIDDSAILSPQDAERITEELMKIWLS